MPHAISYRTQLTQPLGSFAPPSDETEKTNHFENELIRLRDELTRTEEKINTLSGEAIIAMELAEDYENQFLKYTEGINSIISSDSFDLNKARDLASKFGADINLNDNEFFKIIGIKYYSIGFNKGSQKQTTLSVSDKEAIQQIRSMNVGKDSAEGMTEELFSKYNIEWPNDFIKTKVGYVLKGLSIDESTKNLFYDEDYCNETFYQYMHGFVTGILR